MPVKNKILLVKFVDDGKIGGINMEEDQTIRDWMTLKIEIMKVGCSLIIQTAV